MLDMLGDNVERQLTLTCKFSGLKINTRPYRMLLEKKIIKVGVFKRIEKRFYIQVVFIFSKERKYTRNIIFNENDNYND